VQRKVVTVLFCDVTGFTALGEQLDPEALQALLARYFERMKAIVELHGGTVEKFIGDAVMSVFGVPVAHEDDALRALRAATQMRAALPELGVEARMGVNTGEVVTGTEERLATGDAVTVAARLEQAAAPDEILVGSATFELTRDAVEADPVDPLTLKGKADPVPAYRLVRVHEPAERRHEGPFVGRELELERVLQSWLTAVAEHRCQLVTVVGTPGVGKSRLAAEFLARAEANAARGRCLPYGEGITYWPVVEVLKQLRPRIFDEPVGRALAVVLGDGGTATSEEIAWAFRKVLEHAGGERPLVVVFDDIQWAEETFLDLVEHVALLSSGAPLLLLCMARPELLDRRPTWPVAMHLDPLTGAEIDEVIGDRVPPDLRSRIVDLAGGVPLFAEEMVAMAAGSKGDVVVPPSLQALLAARIDQLGPAERRVLECASIEGEVFHRGAVQALAPEEQQVTARLAGLVRRQLVVPDRSQIPGDDGFRFRHLLIRDAAYEGLAKSTRADLHERFAGWLDSREPGLVEADEVVGYHFEQTYRYRTELGPPDERALAARTHARERLHASGRRALLRSDVRAALNLLRRALELTDADDPAVSLRLDYSDAVDRSGAKERAVEVAEHAAALARSAGDRVGELRASLRAVRRNWWLEVSVTSADLQAVVDEARLVFEQVGDEPGLTEVYLAIAELENNRCRQAGTLDALTTAAVHADRAGDAHAQREILTNIAAANWFGPTPVRDAMTWLDEQSPRWDPGDPGFRQHRAILLAMLGRFGEARTLISQARAQAADFGLPPRLGPLWWVEIHEGDYGAAAQELRRLCELLEEIGETGRLSSLRGTLGESLYELGRDAEAEEALAAGEALTMSDDVTNQVLFRRVRAKMLARRGEHAPAELLAREAVVIAERTDMLMQQGNAHADLADVLVMAGQPAEAEDELRQALERYERKENVVMAGRIRERLAALAGNTGRVRDRTPRT
jgi:class 3 adenylate cyclase/tetratricopeptide (TPR) repeat protein